MPIETYHTVSERYDPNFTKFDPSIEGSHSSIYTTDDPVMSGSYSNSFVSEKELSELSETLKKSIMSGSNSVFKWEPERMKSLYLNLNNPMVVDAMGSDWSNIPFSSLPSNVQENLNTIRKAFSTREIETIQKHFGYDGAIIKNVSDWGSGKVPKLTAANVYEINDPANLKLSQAITHDDAGKIIPLSKRDNWKNPDIRYSFAPIGLAGLTGLEYNIENEKPNNYADGGEVQPDTIDPVDMYNKTRYQVNGIPINDKPLDNVLSPWDIPLGTAYKVWPAVNSFLKNYGPTLGAMVVGSTGKTSNKKSSPITTKQIDPTLKEYHEDIVIPLRPQDKYTKQVYLNNPDNFTYNMYADDILPNNRLADYNPRTGEIRIKESVANSELSPQIQGHESGHRIDQIMPRTDEVKQKIDEALQVGPRPLSKESRLLVEKEGEIDRLGYNLFKYMKDNNLMQIKEPTAKTKAFQEFITNATDEQIAQMLGDITAYTKDYKRGKIDYNQIRWILQNAPIIVPGLVIQQDLLTDKT